jgi:phenylacetate-CoA ligase
VVVGYAGNLIELARFVRDQPGALAWKPRRLITAAEGLLPGQRELIEAHLGGRVWMSYGSREFMLIGMECAEQRGYHLAADNLLVEVVDDGGAAARPGATGRILITDLHNAANPFIRYEIGDLGALAPPGHRCPCGRPFPVLSRVEGRVQEVIVLPGGDRLTALFIPHLMKEFPEVQGYQIVQPTARRLEVNLIAGGPLAPELTGRIEAQLRRRVGAEMEIVLARVAQLRRNRTGKTPIVISAAQEGR